MRKLHDLSEVNVCSTRRLIVHPQSQTCHFVNTRSLVGQHLVDVQGGGATSRFRRDFEGPHWMLGFGTSVDAESFVRGDRYSGSERRILPALGHSDIDPPGAGAGGQVACLIMRTLVWVCRSDP